MDRPIDGHLKGFPIFTLFYVLGLLHNQDSNCTTSKIDPLLLPWAKTSFIGKKNFFSRDPTSQRVGKANGPALILMHGRLLLEKKKIQNGAQTDIIYSRGQKHRFSSY